ncbi:MAG TPA: ORF6N domain-containing protein [Candidatus Goldiibacteriota bacterium]|nr:ORF6N domain-containing protein [Candidatus Goldiibacteriota bacterium]
MTSIIPIERIVDRIYFVRGEKVMLDRDLAELYGVETKALKRAVNRNISRFPPDFMIKLGLKESAVLRRQFGALKRGGHSKYEAYGFTEHGVAMLSGILRSGKAVEINILIIRAFIKIRELLSAHKKLAMKIAQLEAKHDEQFVAVFNALQQLAKQKKV